MGMAVLKTILSFFANKNDKYKKKNLKKTAGQLKEKKAVPKIEKRQIKSLPYSPKNL